VKRIYLLISSLSVLVTLPASAKEPFPIDVGHPPPRFQFMIRDNPANLRFDLVMISHDNRPICISHGGWPDAAGHVDWGSQWVEVKSLQRKFPARDWDFGYCVDGECTTQIPPHGSLKGFINYAEFGDPKEIAELPQRQLEFETTPHLCNLNKQTVPNEQQKSTGGVATSATVPNYGDVPTGENNELYRRIIESKLFVTRADCARMTVRPLSKPEFALSVYSGRRHRSPARRLYYVTVTEASKRIYESLQENGVGAISVDRRTARIPARTAIALKQLWKKMLSQANPTDAPPDLIDGESIEFSLDTSPNSISVDELPAVAKDQSVALERLRNLLVDYCTADWDERAVLDRQIRRNARGLSDRL